jgi:hypothetical protein
MAKPKIAHLRTATTRNNGAILAMINGVICMSSKREQVAVRLEPELREKLQARADQDKRPLAGLIRKILHDATQAPQAAA